MRLLNVRANNVLAFSNVELDFRDAGSVIGIRATYEGEPGRSNRAGKSALIYDLPLFALSGFSRTGTAADVVRRGHDEGWVEVVVEARGNEFTVRRTQRGRSSSVSISGFEGLSVRDANEKIEELLGIPVDDLRRVSLFEQGDTLGFLGGDQRRILARWLDQSHWEKAATAAGVRLREANGELVRATDRLNVAQDLIARKDELVSTKEEADVLVSSLEAELESMQEAARCEEQKGAVEHAKTEVRLAEANLDNVRRLSTAKRESALAELRGIIDVHRSVAEEKRSALAVISRSVANSSDDIASAERRRDRLLVAAQRANEAARLAMLGSTSLDAPCHIVDDTPCSALRNQREVEGRTILDDSFRIAKEAQEGAENASEEVDRVRRIGSKLEASLAEANDTLDLADEKVTAARENLHFGTMKVDDELSSEITEAESLLLDKKKELSTAEAELAEATRMTSELGMFELRRRLRDARTKAIEATSDLDRVIDIEESIDEISAAEGIASRKARSLRILRTAFSKDGIPSRVVEGYLDELAGDANDFLERLAAEPRIEWRTWKRLQKWQTECRACGCAEKTGRGGKSRCADCGSPWERARKEDFACVLKYGNSEAPLGSDSGGGKTLVALAVRFALSRLVARARGAEADMLVLDEPFAALDAVNRAAAIELVTNVLGGYGVRQCFIVSHVPEVQEAVSDIVTVTRRGTVSDVSTSWGG